MSPPLKHAITAFGKTMSLREWAKEVGVSYGCLRHRIIHLGWDPERAISEPAMTAKEAADNASRVLAGLRKNPWRSDYLEREEMWPGAREARYEEDMVARVLVRDYGPFTLDEIGLFLGFGRERVRQIEAEALAKCAREAHRLGIDLHGILEELGGKGEDVYPDWDYAA
jgi:hypothetical protein